MNATCKNIVLFNQRRAKSLLYCKTPRHASFFASRLGLEPEKKKGLLYRMAPPKGGTEPPDAKFLVVASIVLGAGYYSWFIHKDDNSP
mmetsp:Transcript_20282/g.36799  ORF Transcript_20282/g.36799 Transcript_20282/m.36799 type:complete len:88 (+) Transcript_20282:56-319(+)